MKRINIFCHLNIKINVHVSLHLEHHSYPKIILENEHEPHKKENNSNIIPELYALKQDTSNTEHSEKINYHV
jgi:hypothetical protein